MHASGPRAHDVQTQILRCRMTNEDGVALSTGSKLDVSATAALVSVSMF